MANMCSLYGAEMGFTNPGIPWNELERRLSDRSPAGRVAEPVTGDAEW